MIELNLLSHLSRPCRLKRLYNLPIFELGLGLILFSLCLHFSLKALSAHLQADYKRLNKEWEIASPNKKELNSRVRQLKRLNKRLSIMKELVGRPYYWTDRLFTLGKIIPEDLWIDKLSFSGDKDKRLFSLRGSQVYLEKSYMSSLAQFISSLKRQDSFQGIDLHIDKITQRKIKDIQIMDFLLIARKE